MVLLSAAWGRKHYPIPYPLGRLSALLLAACLLVWVQQLLDASMLVRSYPALLWTQRLLAPLLYLGLAWLIEGRHLWRDLRSG
jgi:hypothetical protein